MKRIYTYPLILLALFALFVAYGDRLFGHKETESVADIIYKKDYAHNSKYVYLSPFDDHFRDAAEIIGYDWKLIAAIAYTESRFDSMAVSQAGACGVMQVMPNTLRGFDIPDSLHMEPRRNIMAATELLRALDRRFKYIHNKEERINFVLASYNAGYGHIQDAMQLARKEGKNRFVWNNSVDSFLVYKSMPEYYTDTLCRNGQFNGWRETLSFVKKVQRNWKRFTRLQQEYTDSLAIVARKEHAAFTK